MDDPCSEEIKKQMAHTRSKLAEKLETLEEQIIEPAATAVTETAASVKEAVGGTAEAVKMVTSTLDISSHVRQHPWRMMGAGVLAGFLLGRLLKAAVLEVRPPRDASPPSSPQPILGPKRGQQHQQNGIYSPEKGTAEARLGDSQPSPKTGEGWGRLATEIQSTLIHGLAPVCQGLIGAALAEFLRPTNREHERGSELDAKRDTEWGGRFRSTPH